MSDSTYIDNKCEGVVLSFHDEKGTKNKRSIYKNDMLNGNEKEFYPNGNLRREYEYKDHALIKVHRIQDEKGREMILPLGEIFVWKACKITLGFGSRPLFVIVKLLVPKDAKRVTPMDDDNKYSSRVEKAIVVSIRDVNYNEFKTCQSFVHKDSTLEYTVGQVVTASGLELDPSLVGGEGIYVHPYSDLCYQWQCYL